MNCKRMLVLCPFPEGVAAGQRLKYEQYFDDWRSMDYVIDVSPYMDEDFWSIVYKQGYLSRKAFGVIRGHMRRVRDIFRIRNYDVVYVFMWVTPFGTSVFERLVRSLARRLIFDVEDNVLIEQNLPIKLNPNTIARFFKGPQKARFLIKRSDHVITSSPFLNDFCKRINSNGLCTYISSSVDVVRFTPRCGVQGEEVPTIGWTGTFSSRIYLDLLRGVFQELSKRKKYRLVVIGNFDYELEGVDLHVIQWTKENEVLDLQSIDIGVYPLPINDWVLGKSGLKAIQYMALGLPIVATDVGTTSLLIENDVNGLLVKSDDEWLYALERLLNEPELRRRLGKVARDTVIEKYSTKAIAVEYRRVLQSLTEHSCE